ncbi:hypothetical protein BDD12DRAFT_873314 [Trichophaea hybrida]|nr:hypothetical protein BDD12DRAFT_873314 [Trichophaea hybrida]
MAEDTVKTKVTYIYHTYCKAKEMFEDNEQHKSKLATYLSGHLNAFMNGTGVWDAMAEHGLYPENDGEGVEEEL